MDVKKRLLVMNRFFRVIVFSMLCALTTNLSAQIQPATDLTPNSAQYTIPSWTLYKRALTSSINNPQTKAALVNAKQYLVVKSIPYSVNMTINGDPSSNMGFTWFTNHGEIEEMINIIKGSAKDTSDFTKPLWTIKATSEAVNNLNYCVAANNLSKLAGIPNNTRKSYTSNKALVTGLKANTSYSFIVGKPGAWSKIGSFTTAKKNKDDFSFIYFTDPQANSDEQFDISQKTTHAAVNMFPNANFLLSCGDLVNSTGTSNSEWEYEQFFETQQDIWYTKPFAPVIGNHDFSPNKNFYYHFNTASTSFDKKMATVPGSVYSFVYGDALFMALDFEDYRVNGYLDSLSVWMKKEVLAHPDVKWKIAFYHKTIYTGGNIHQVGLDSKIVRNKMAPLFDELKIDLAIQGHDHIYEVIGPIKNKAVVENSVSKQGKVQPSYRINVTGKVGGTFDVTNGTLYFLNNSSGKKKYEPTDSETMKSVEANLGIVDYFSFFTGRFGQTGEPTFSNISVSTAAININTYTVDDNGKATLFDKISIVKKAK